ncbi:flagellar export chaperone FliS [Sphingomonas oryzagri]|jgi:flagellar protein FliS|uniref:Flagellar protein FliS n=1 Tax=Sphingomonas oryzagri TaxID=3042314 RepID=A0ABT6N4A8_9SPHN|nr:flagellar protein FliS [Sphingomonas oryzagri]MDH7639604.1 flagellar protein FliS [Sphingomonas oryzagri]
MYASAGYASAKKSYANVDIGARVEASSPHQLVAVLFEELLKSLDTLIVGLGANGTLNRSQVIVRRARANTILLGLEGSLDRRQGGEIAAGLSAIYREARRLIAAGSDAGDAEPIREARTMIAQISEAWAQIG